MSAETLGENLLKGLKEEGLDEFLQSLRNSDTSCTSPPIRLPPLDSLLEIFQNAPSWRSQQPSSHQSALEPSLPHPQQDTSKVSSSPVLELTSATACSGKTQLLHKIVTLALLPSTHGAIPIGGRSSAVILLDVGSNISILRLRQVMTAHIATCVLKSHSPPLSSQEINSLIHAALLHLHVFRPQSAASLAATLAYLPDYIFAQPYEHFSASRPIGALVLANLTAFYWQDRSQPSNLPQHRLPSTSNFNSDNTNNCRSLISTLRSLQRSFSCSIIITTSTLSTPSSLPDRGNHRILRPNMPAPWSSFVTAQVVLERVSVPKFAPGISAQEASEERALRQGAVARGERRGWVNWWGEGGWREEVREGIRRWERDWEGGLKVWIGEGVAVGGEE